MESEHLTNRKMRFHKKFTGTKTEWKALTFANQQKFYSDQNALKSNEKALSRRSAAKRKGKNVSVVKGKRTSEVNRSRNFARRIQTLISQTIKLNSDLANHQSTHGSEIDTISITTVVTSILK